jgi:15-cis-phytoene synthase
MTQLERSYEHCRHVARTQARNFYYSFLLLPKPKRDAMCAIYAFMRRSDDLSDGPQAVDADAMERWRAEMVDALEGRYSANPVWPAFHDTVSRYRIPVQYFHDVIDGVRSDLEPREFHTFAELYRYCYQVASVVGLTTVHIFGFDDPKVLELAEKCGIAFQLTNIIRDVKEDADNGRTYLPREDRERYVDLKYVLRFEGERAREYYEESRPIIGLVHADSRRAMWALFTIYSRLLEKIEAADYEVMERRIALSTAEKLRIVARAMLGWM